MSEPLTTRLMTAEEFAALPDDGMRRELIAGEVIEMPPPGWDHGEIAGFLAGVLIVFVRAHGLGRAAGNDPGVIVAKSPDTVLAPDAAFYAAGRLPDERVTTYTEIPPDLVVEVASPTDRPRDVMAKATQWQQAGVRVIWIVWPATQRVTVLSEDEPLMLSRRDTLTCEALLPGFALPLEEVFVDWGAETKHG